MSTNKYIELPKEVGRVRMSKRAISVGFHRRKDCLSFPLFTSSLLHHPSIEWTAKMALEFGKRPKVRLEGVERSSCDT